VISVTKARQMRNEDDVPSVETLLRDPSTSFWMRNALVSAMSRDPVDSANDAELLAKVLNRRCERLLKETTT
jgi:hypothetical protein